MDLHGLEAFKFCEDGVGFKSSYYILLGFFFDTGLYGVTNSSTGFHKPADQSKLILLITKIPLTAISYIFMLSTYSQFMLYLYHNYRVATIN